tara:strand:- start:149 stop:289 length:141 start_codon:yes stop_codon:yes gene_type:complete
MIFMIFLYAWFSMIITLQDLTPPPTDPEHAPIKAPISSRNDIDNGH